MADQCVNPDAPGAAPAASGDSARGDHRVGKFQFLHADDRWQWSPEVAAMHGYSPVAMTVDSATVLGHKHPADRESVNAAIAESIRSGAPFSSRHRIIDAAGRERQVVVVGSALTDETGAVAGTEGFCLDETAAIERDVKAGLLSRSMTSAVRGR